MSCMAIFYSVVIVILHMIKKREKIYDVTREWRNMQCRGILTMLTGNEEYGDNGQWKLTMR